MAKPNRQQTRYAAKLLLYLAMMATVTLFSVRPGHAVTWDWHLAFCPSDEKGLTNAAQLYRSGEVENCLIALGNIKLARPNDCRVLHIIAEVYKETKRFTEAKQTLSDLLALEQKIGSAPYIDIPQIKYEIAQVCQEMGRDDEALPLYLQVTEADPKNAFFRLSVAKTYERLGELSNARESYVLSLNLVRETDIRDFINERIAHIDDLQANPGKQVRKPPPGPPPGSSGSASSFPSSLGSSGHSSIPDSNFATGHSSISSAGGGTTSGGGGTTSANAPQITSPVLKDALQDMSSKNYTSAITKLQNHLAKNKTDGEGHYLLAVCLVATRKFSDAAKEYELALEHANNLKLQKLASQGLAKLQKSP